MVHHQLLYINCTRFVVEPKGVSNVFLTIFDNFLGVNEDLGGWEAPEVG